MMGSFKERDLEILLNLLHNIGGSLRKESPELILEIIQECDLKKNIAEAAGKVDSVDMTRFLRKVKFL